jgi:hypothetical protein
MFRTNICGVLLESWSEGWCIVFEQREYGALFLFVVYCFVSIGCESPQLRVKPAIEACLIQHTHTNKYSASTQSLHPPS